MSNKAMPKPHECVICGIHFTGYGHNPDPFGEGTHEERSCDECNFRFVIPARLTKLQPRDRELLKHFARLGAAFSRMKDLPLKPTAANESRVVDL